MKRICLFVAVLLLCLCAPARAETIRVGYYDYPGFLEQNEQGDMTGYGFAYLQEIAKYTGWSYDFQPMSLTQCLVGLSGGELDLVGGLRYIDARAQVFDYTDVAIGTEYITLLVREEDDRYAYLDAEAFSQMRIGLLTGSYRNAAFARYCEESGVAMETVDYLTQEALDAAIAEGAIDAMLGSDTRAHPGLREVARFAPDSFYWIMAQGREDFRRELNRAIVAIQAKRPDFEVALHKQFFGFAAGETAVFSLAERRFVETSGEYTVAYCPNWQPFSYDGAADDGYAGITAEIFQEISRQTGLRFHYARAANYEDALRMVRTGEADLLFSMEGDYNWAERNRQRLTGAYISLPVVVVAAPQSADAEQTIALPGGINLAERLTRDLPGAKIRYYDNYEQCFEALRAGDADVVYANTYIASYYLSDSRFARFSSMAVARYTQDLCLGVAKDIDVSLVSILDKALSSFSDVELTAALVKHSIVPKSVSVSDFIYQYPLQSIILAVGVSLGAAFLCAYFLVSRSRHAREINRLLYRDQLTGLDTLMKFQIEADERLRAQPNTKFALVYSDIRHFKLLNDAYGYEIGDRVLKHIASVLLQKGNRLLAGRVTGDNFVSMFPYETEEDLRANYESVVAQASDIHAIVSGHPGIQISSGIYCTTGDDASITVQGMLDRANIAQREAVKEPGRGYALYSERVRMSLLEEQQFENEMWDALKNSEFQLYLQPQYELTHNALCGAEALVRWQHPQLGNVSPGKFVPLFERNGFVCELDTYMLRQVCATLRRWIDEGKHPTPLSVNVSPALLGRGDFLATYDAIKRQYRVPDDMVELEFTESMMFDNAERMREVLAFCKGHGFRCAMDDFGSGYSSLNLLKDFPVDTLKLDGQFFTNSKRSEREEIIIQTVLRMGRQLRVRTIAEGVETPDTVDFLRMNGCDVVQGYVFARPVPAEEFEESYL